MNRGLGEVDFNPHEWLWRLQNFGEEIALDVVEIERELELEMEPEYVTESLESHDQILTPEELLYEIYT